MVELPYGDWNTDTQDSTNIDIQGDTFTLASAIPDSVVSRPDDSGSGNNQDLGLQFETSQQWPDFQARISANTSPSSTAEMYIEDTGGTEIVAIDISGNSANDIVTLSNADLAANTTYRIVIRTTDDTDITYGFADASYPYTSSDGNLSITAGWDRNAGSTVSDFAYMIKEIGNINL